jgi:hypothetical protein
LLDPTGAKVAEGIFGFANRLQLAVDGEQSSFGSRRANIDSKK